MISIHAPAKGATTRTMQMRLSISYFNPRSREGSDTFPKSRYYRKISFQSTLPRRERRKLSICIQYDKNFNPRSREGSDDVTDCTKLNKTISIHAPAKGATRSCRLRFTLCLFQSTLPRRERPFLLHLRAPSRLFQSTLPRRERLVI